MPARPSGRSTGCTRRRRRSSASRRRRGPCARSPRRARRARGVRHPAEAEPHHDPCFFVAKSRKKRPAGGRRNARPRGGSRWSRAPSAPRGRQLASASLGPACAGWPAAAPGPPPLGERVLDELVAAHVVLREHHVGVVFLEAVLDPAQELDLHLDVRGTPRRPSPERPHEAPSAGCRPSRSRRGAPSLRGSGTRGSRCAEPGDDLPALLEHGPAGAVSTARCPSRSKSSTPSPSRAGVSE